MTAVPGEEPDDGARRDARGISSRLAGSLRLLGWAAWVGLIAGFAELAGLVFLRYRTGEVLPLLGKSDQYPWMVPLTNALLFVAVVLPFATIGAFRRRARARSAAYLLAALAPLPCLMLLISNVPAAALLTLTSGLAVWWVPFVRRRSRGLVRLARLSAPVMLIALIALGFFASGTWARWSSYSGARSLRNVRGKPNVILVVWDTVRADHLGLYGYQRSTAPRLEALAARGVVFRHAYATAPWTLPSHASILTGRWPRDVLTGRYGALDRACPTLAEVLAREGYQTVGVVANTFFCGFGTGLGRGFESYLDVPATPWRALLTTRLGDLAVGWIDHAAERLDPTEARTSLRAYHKDAATVNRQFLDWLDQHKTTDTPYFAFLNYFDAHDPYLVRDHRPYRFGRPPRDANERRLLLTWWFWPDKVAISKAQGELLRDAYDSCIADLDENFASLINELERRAALDNTIVIITSDHGEAFGEHGLYGHGGSLYEDQLRVPLIILTPATTGPVATRAVDDVVSLRDLPATVLDLLGLDRGPIPGASLASLWGPNSPGAVRAVPSTPRATVDVPDSFPPNEGRSPVFAGPMTAIIRRDLFKYIRIEGPLGPFEELYAIDVDPSEQANLAALPSGAPLLDSFRRMPESP